MDKGVSGVVAMRYNVYVVTAAQFVAELYGALVDGFPLGEAVTLGGAAPFFVQRNSIVALESAEPPHFSAEGR
jgi:hypothetical protein